MSYRTEVVEMIANAMRESFKARIGETANMPFEETGVVVPGDAVWARYAEDVRRAIKEDGYVHYFDEDDVK
jgi:hypothetical protein